MKKLLTIVITAVLLITCILTLISCDSADYTVGICQLVTHDALDAATQGFMDALQEEMDKAGKTVKFDLQNAQNDASICTTIVNKFNAQQVDLILANATPALDAARSVTKTIPILGTSITEYGVALGRDDITNGIIGGNISGTSDLAPLDRQAQMIVDLVPSAQKVGLLYCSAEPNSSFQANEIKKYLEAAGKTCTVYTFTDTTDISAIAESAAQNSDVIYVPTDNTVAHNTSTIDTACKKYNVPVIAGEEGICKGCGIATLSISYYNLGVATGKMAAQILLNGADISTMKIAYDEEPVYKYDKERCELYGITVPDNYVELVK